MRMVTGLYRKQKKISATPIDQARKQNNALVKKSGGTIGLLQDCVTLRKWLLAGPEQAQLIKEFEEQFFGK